MPESWLNMANKKANKRGKRNFLENNGTSGLDEVVVASAWMARRVLVRSTRAALILAACRGACAGAACPSEAGDARGVE